MARFKNPTIDRIEHFDRRPTREVRKVETVTKPGSLWSRFVEWLWG